MTPQLEAALAAIKPLSATERLQLLQILTQESPNPDLEKDLKFLSFQFWQGISLDELRKTQPCKTFNNAKDFTADFWPQEDTIEDFLTFLHQQRQEINLISNHGSSPH